MHDAQAGPSSSIARALSAALSLSLRRLVRSRFMIGNVLIAGVPLLFAIVVAMWGDIERLSMANDVHAVLLRTYFLHFATFFLANILGFAVVRQEMESRTLHYLFLAPVPRWIIFSARYVAYLVLIGSLGAFSLVLTYLILAFTVGSIREVTVELLGNGRMVTLLGQCGVMLLGLAAYGAIAMLAGSFFRSGLYTLFLVTWEWTLPYLPQVLKKWTILHYLQSLMPGAEPRMGRLFELLGTPSPIGVSLTVLLSVTAVMLALAMLVFQRRECLYADS